MKWELEEKYLEDDPNLYYDGYLDYGNEYSLNVFMDELKIYNEIECLRYEIVNRTEREVEFIKFRGRNEELEGFNELENFICYNDIITDTYIYIYGIEPYSFEDMKQYFIEGSFLNDAEQYLSFLKNKNKGLKAKGYIRRHSKGEELLNQILINEKYKFVREESDGCINNETFYLLPFDFIVYINSIKIYIEVQGGQHYKPVSFNNKNNETAEITFKRLKQRDAIKKKFAEENGIFVELNYSEGNVNKLKERIYDELLPLLEKIRGEKNDKQ